MPRSLHARKYKEVTLQQLRSFCETARLGSLKAAALALQLARPTVWQQVHALERELGIPLIETHGRGSRLTDEGRLLAELAAPLVTGITSLKRNFQERRGQAHVRLTIALTQRTLVEDLPAAIAEFERRHPRVHLCFKEMGTEQVTAAVQLEQVDLGVTTDRGPTPASPWLEFEPAYDLDLFLVTPRNHPLARRRTVVPADLLPYPLLNAPHSMPDPMMNAALDKLGLFHTEPRRVEVSYTAAIRHYVAMGFGIGLVVGLPSRPMSRTLHERSMSRHFGRVTVNLVWRKGTQRNDGARLFADILKKTLG